MFESPEPIPLRAKLELALYAPLGHSKSVLQHVRLSADVRWIAEIAEALRHEGRNRYRVGAAFEQKEDTLQISSS